LCDILVRLDAAATVDDMNVPGFKLHPLKGDRKGFWAITVRANWRSFVLMLATRKTWTMSITIELKEVETMPMKNPPHPGGFVLRQCIEPLGLTITDAAAALGVTRTTLSELVHGHRGVSPEMAVRLSKVFGGSAQSWLTQQAQYDLAHVRADRIKLKRLELA
jgi:addiction module HigA family antidote